MVDFNCDYCKKACKRPNWEYKRTLNHFCSQSCAKSYKNVNISPLPKFGDKKHGLMFIKHIDCKGESKYECLCDCGRKTIIKRSKFGKNYSCGYRPNHKGTDHALYKGYKDISANYWGTIVAGAKKRNLKFEITKEYIWNLFNKQNGKCALSGQTINLNKNKGMEHTASLDRIDSQLGYLKGNVQWIHKYLNKMKMAMSDKNFINLCTKVADYRGMVEKLDFEDVLIKPQRSSLTSRSEVDLFQNNSEFFGKCIPVIASNIDTVGTFSMCRELIKHKLMTCLSKHYSKEQYIDFFKTLSDDEKKLVFYSVGANDKDHKKLKYVCKHVEIKNVCLDVANAYSPVVYKALEVINKISSKFVIMLGNIATPEIIEYLKDYNVKYLKAGLGCGAVCITRKVTGIGIPQLSCVLDCVSEAKIHNIKICSDGGCKMSGDVVKAFGAGASMVMLGSMLAGHNECEAEWNEDGMIFYGMASKEAMNKYQNVENYRASEGKCVSVKAKGPITHTVQEILGGLRSACTYVGAKNLIELPSKTTFVRVSRTHNNMFGY